MKELLQFITREIDSPRVLLPLADRSSPRRMGYVIGALSRLQPVLQVRH